MPEPKRFTRNEVKDLDPKTQTVFIIDNVVYDVQAFLDEHPGGHEVLKGAAGSDATEDFDDVGHSLDAKELMKKFVVGELVDEERSQSKKKQMKWEESAAAASAGEGGFLSSWKFPLLVGVLVTLLYTYLLG